jgi:RES domain-containing protein
VTIAYSLSSRRYPANDGRGAALYGGRWNPVGVEVIYAAMSPSLAALEILVHFDVLPGNFVLSVIQIPPRACIQKLEDVDLPAKWNRDVPIAATQKLGAEWVRQGQSPVWSVPSTIVPIERKLVLNRAHPDFRLIRFRPPVPFRFDSRLKQ